MAEPGKVIHIDFQKGRKPVRGAFGGGPRLVVAIMAATLAVIVAAVAAVHPEGIASPFFGPVAVVVAVLMALGARKVIAYLQAHRLHRELADRSSSGPDDNPRGHTLH
jgi:hypothetical protein